MSESKWTPTPWRVGASSGGYMKDFPGHVVDQPGERLVANTCGYSTNTDNGEHVDENHANAERIVACVNALAGVGDPQAFVEAASKAMAALDAFARVADVMDFYVEHAYPECVSYPCDECRTDPEGPGRVDLMRGDFERARQALSSLHRPCGLDVPAPGSRS